MTDEVFEAMGDEIQLLKMQSKLHTRQIVILQKEIKVLEIALKESR